MGKRRPIFFILFVTVLFAFACTYSLFDVVQEADFLSHKKYEGRDIQELYAEKGSNLDAVLVSATLFPPLPNPLLEFLPSFFSSNTLLVMSFSVLRC
jgi:hypothetical protein